MVTPSRSKAYFASLPPSAASNTKVLSPQVKAFFAPFERLVPPSVYDKVVSYSFLAPICNVIPQGHETDADIEPLLNEWCGLNLGMNIADRGFELEPSKPIPPSFNNDKELYTIYRLVCSLALSETGIRLSDSEQLYDHLCALWVSKASEYYASLDESEATLGETASTTQQHDSGESTVPRDIEANTIEELKSSFFSAFQRLMSHGKSAPSGGCDIEYSIQELINHGYGAFLYKEETYPLMVPSIKSVQNALKQPVATLTYVPIDEVFKGHELVEVLDLSQIPDPLTDPSVNTRQ